jgi:hypothetical protein
MFVLEARLRLGSEMGNSLGNGPLVLTRRAPVPIVGQSLRRLRLTSFARRRRRRKFD